MARTTGVRTSAISYTVPGMDKKEAAAVIGLLQDRLHALNDLALTLKHIHWNVVGPHFIGVHLMLDPQVDAVRGMVDAAAERIATLGGSPVGTPGAIVAFHDGFANRWCCPVLVRVESHELLTDDPAGRSNSMCSARSSVVRVTREISETTTMPRMNSAEIAMPSGFSRMFSTNA